ncbi:hypothetical protein GCM10025882_16290 [Acinetobacter gyllenbergii]|nr:hypothetical protein GCM10025882_16290 [Acinetobacter gyllenbergii]
MGKYSREEKRAIIKDLKPFEYVDCLIKKYTFKIKACYKIGLNKGDNNNE